MHSMFTLTAEVFVDSRSDESVNPHNCRVRPILNKDGLGIGILYEHMKASAKAAHGDNWRVATAMTRRHTDIESIPLEDYSF